MNEQELKEQLKQEIRQEMKKSARKKRIIIFAIILVIIAGLFIFYKIQRSTEAELHKRYTYEELAQYKKEIPITTENWKDYITTEDIREENKDAFGNVTSISERTALKLKDNICGYVVLELNIPKNKYRKKETIAITGGQNYQANIVEQVERRTEGNIEISNYRFTIDDLEAVQLKGYIYTIDIPEEIWKTEKSTGKKYILMENDFFYKEDNDYIKILSSREYERYQEQIKNN